MDEAVAAYVDAIPPEHRALFDRVAGLIASVAPAATVRISYGIPTYEVGKKRLYVGVWKHGVSLYGWGQGGDGGFLERHPELQKGKGTIQLTEAAAMKLPDAELERLVRAVLG
ncbi:MAG TPA: DUF1801 domain-containing protein [Acidimicrobiales bacterium]|nr:DUF1801 domain-containing protein [Acidimicrobiales bacterium]